jgi:hypothetical protein
MTDPKLWEQRIRESHDRTLLIGGGSEPRLSLFLDLVQFVNNSIVSPISTPNLVSNGIINGITNFADITVTKCMFKDNYFPFANVRVSRHILIQCLIVSKTSQSNIVATTK